MNMKNIMYNTQLPQVIMVCTFIIILLTGCDKPRLNYYLPNNVIITCTTIKDFEEYFELKNFDYEGFKGTINDSIFNDFIINTSKHESIFGSDILNEKEVSKAKNYKALSIKFDCVRANEISLLEIQNYLNEEYNYNLSFHVKEKENGTNVSISYNIKFKDTSIGQLDLNKEGVPCYFLTLYGV